MRLLTAFVIFLSCAGLQAAAQNVTAVEAAKVTVGPISERVTAVGSLSANESVIIRPEVAGRVVEIGFEEGRPVAKGAVLLKLDDSLNKAEVAEAAARLELAKRNHARIEELAAGRIATERQRDEARSSLDVGTATVELARVRLEKTRIVAPFDGFGGLRKVSVGDYVTIGQDMFTLVDIDPIKVDFRISEKFLSAARTGQAIEIGVDAFPGRSFKGEVYAIDPSVDAAGRSVVLRARVDNKDLVLRPGLFARVTLIMELKPNALSVPEQALMPRGDDQFVFKVIDGKAVQAKVKIGNRRDGRVEVVDGLAASDIVVTAGQQKIRDGAAIRVLGGGAEAVSETPAGKGA
ncbi:MULTISPECIES: efflux RND transporter periplasmic adaptor subunit [Rhodomicrobium]|uniref:efflux RND transporter periplasmic adaptor subunit n=1 Tax=Rhodomicrobium TaxID=1068 RepID=UPI001482EBA2|nr:MULTISPECIES: efflux RND transporter periplasmic adaptor subunit [Rhodomicrobium]